MEKTTSVYLKEHVRLYFIVAHELLKYFNKLCIWKIDFFVHSITVWNHLVVWKVLGFWKSNKLFACSCSVKKLQKKKFDLSVVLQGYCPSYWNNSVGQTFCLYYQPCWKLQAEFVDIVLSQQDGSHQAIKFPCNI